MSLLPDNPFLGIAVIVVSATLLNLVLGACIKSMVQIIKINKSQKKE